MVASAGPIAGPQYAFDYTQKAQPTEIGLCEWRRGNTNISKFSKNCFKGTRVFHRIQVCLISINRIGY